MKKTINVLMSVVIGCAFYACSNDTAKEMEVKDADQASLREIIENSEAYNEIKDQLDFYNENEEVELAELRANETPSDNLRDDEPFVFFIMGDSELGMRGNTYSQLLEFIEGINDIESHNLEFINGDFEEGESHQITKPELLLLAGDICGDRTFGFAWPGTENAITKQETNRLFNQLDEDILFFPGNGNHDWDPYQWGSGAYGHGITGLWSNLGTAAFVRSRYTRAINATEEESGASFNYDRNMAWWPAIASSEFNYSFKYKGLRFTQLNQFLQQPVAVLTAESLFGEGPADYLKNKTAAWFQGLCDESATSSNQHVVVQHFPINTGDSWWNDDMGGTPDGLRKEFMDIFEDSHDPIMFTGHNHSRRRTTVQPYDIKDYTSGYFAQGYVIAVKASASKGVYAITHVNLNSMSTSNGEIFGNTYNIPQ